MYGICCFVYPSAQQAPRQLFLVCVKLNDGQHCDPLIIQFGEELDLFLFLFFLECNTHTHAGDHVRMLPLSMGGGGEKKSYLL